MCTRAMDLMPKGARSAVDVAITAGMDLSFSCSFGMCGTGRARLLHGRVRMDRHLGQGKSNSGAGFIFSCQGHPLTGPVEMSFDER